jgi:YfiH family protein
MAPFADHVFTDRSWLLGRPSRSDDATGWEEIARALALDAGRLVRSRQVHGSTVAVHRDDQPLAGRPNADIVIVGNSGAGAAIQTADCVPLLFVDTRSGAIAAAHAGWRGMADRVPIVTVEAMEKEFGSRASKLIAAVGPSIGPCCYEVGADVRDRFGAASFSEYELGRWFSDEPRASPANPSIARVDAAGRRWFLDLWAAARDQLRAAGVREDRIFVAGLCSASHPSAFCSYRRDGAGAGRMAAAIRSSNETTAFSNSM